LGTVLLRGANVITMRGGEVVRNADVVIKDNRIVAVGARSQVRVPAGARVMDVAGDTIIPGLIDVHAHFDIPRGVVDPGTWEFATNLAYGVTSVREPQSMTNDIFVYSDLVEAGDMPGPRIFSTGPGLFAQPNFQSYQDVLQAVTRYARYYKTNLLKSYEVGDRQTRQWVIRACRELHMMPTTEGGADLR
jgi:hypothetical protein